MDAETTQIQPGDCVGSDCIGVAGIFLLGLYLVFAAWIVSYSLVTLWPGEPLPSGTTTTAPANPPGGGSTVANPPAVPQARPAPAAVSRSTFLWTHVEFTFQQRMLVIVLLAGALGGIIHALRSFFWYVGHRALKWSWLPLYLLVPLVGALLALVFYIVLIAGLFAGPAGTDATKPVGFVAIALLVGMFSSPAAQKLQEIFETIFTKRQQGAETVAGGVTAAAPVIQAVTANLPGPGARTITIKGSGFQPPVKIRLQDPTGTPVHAAAKNATATSSDVDVNLTAGDWLVSLMGADGKESNAFKFTV